MTQTDIPFTLDQTRAPTPARAGRWLSQPFEIKPEPRAALLLSAVLWSFVVLLVSLVVLPAGYVRTPGEYATMVLGTLSGVGIAFLLYLVFRALAGRPAWLAMTMLIPAVILAGFVQMAADYGGQFLAHSLTDNMVMPDSSPPAMMKVAMVYVSIYATNAALFWVTFANRRVREQQLLVAERSAAALRSELRVLRLQLNPHFMFNALSAVSSLILAGRGDEAERVTQKLSEFLRAAIDIDAGEDIRLGEELSVLDAYLAVEAQRFGERLRLVVDCDPEVEAALVPNLLLQPLVENAMKYAVEPSMAPVVVTIVARVHGAKLRLEVRDEGAVLGAAGRPGPGHGVGLEATRNRLKLAYGDQARLTAGPRPGGFGVVIDMPLRS